jgi:hypothetical protein
MTDGNRNLTTSARGDMFTVALHKETGELLIIERTSQPADGSPKLHFCRASNGIRAFVYTDDEVTVLPTTEFAPC